MSMTDYFFSVNHSDCKKYFEGLDIWKEEKFRELQGTYPVIFMSFADIKGTTYEKTRMGIIHKITKLYADFEFLKETGVLSGRDLEFYDSVSVDMGDDVAGIAIQYMCDYLRRYYGRMR
ncbi:AAA family ATPase [Mediterraneibacter faecis]|uniref:AAA family ATPase n=1 Tax=Mediterraneibacter faecis TaxID=592978 RepID=UPI0022E60BA5|nr:AAA family ATPase [Mediterraneibacter faecis]